MHVPFACAVYIEKQSADATDPRLREGDEKKLPPLSELKTPLRDGDIERPEDPAYAGHWFLNANSDRAPGTVDAHAQLISPDEVYSGCYGKISVTFYGYNSNGNRGIAAGLGNIQKLRDGEPLGGRTNAADDFQSEDDDDFLA